MKKHFVVLSLGILTVLLSTSMKPNDSDYGPWKTTSCFRGLDFCVKRGAYNEYAKKYDWGVKFRNRYQQKVSFSYTAKDSYVSSARGTERMGIRSGDEGSSWFLIADGNSINVFVDNLRFGEDDYGTKYASCDN